MKTVCIIGGGIGGLMTGALMTKEGYRVTILEKNHTVGGGLQSFSRHGHLFDPCMHIFGGMQPGGNLRGILEHLGIADTLKTTPYYDTIVYGDERITLPFGRKAWIEAVGQGEHKQELNAYVDALYHLADTENLFNLRPDTVEVEVAENITAKELIERHIGDEHLRNRLTFIAHLYGGTTDSPALLHALTSVLHIDGVYAIVSSAQSLADLLCGIITSGGGEIHTDSPVTTIESDGKQVTSVVCNNERYCADNYISAISIGALLRIAPREAFSTAFRKRIEAAEQCCSAFCVYGILKHGTLEQQNAGYHILRQGVDPWNLASVQPDRWPHNMFLMTQSDSGDQRYADTMTIVAPMDFNYVSPWADSTHSHRPEGYRNWKTAMTEQAMQMAQEVLGPLETTYIEAASPLTIRDYSGTTRGTCYGMHSSAQNLATTTLVPRTRLANLFLTGQDVNFHGLVGTSLTAVLTAETIVGRNKIVNSIKSE